ncbi:MAG: C25 family cysteine peptidase [Pseudomonadota bacterium]
MHARLLGLALLVCMSPNPAKATPTWVGLEREAPDDGTPWSIQLQRLDGDLVRVEMTLDGFLRVPVDQGGSRFEEIRLPGAGTTRTPGLPALPMLRQRLLGALDGTPQILQIEADTVRIDDVIPAPHTPRPKRCGGEWSERTTCDAEWYQSGEVFPETWAEVHRGGLLRSIPVVELTLSPFRYHPATRELEVARRLVITLSMAPLDGAALPARAFSRPFTEEVKRTFLDPFPALREGPQGATERLLVLAHDDLAPALDEYITWKRNSGLDVDLVLLSSVGSTWTDVAQFLSDEYFDAAVAPTYVLLVGDGEGPTTVPYVPSPFGCASDFLYTTVDGGDLYSDFLIGRFSADALSQAALQAGKVIWYERDLLPEAGSWVPRSICISSSEGSGGSNDDVRSDIVCGLQDAAGYETSKLYNSMGNDTAANISSSINEGLGWITYLGHGSGTSWATTSPPYSSSHITQLQNTDMLPVIMDVSCSNGGFDSGDGDCFAEAWLKTGAVGDLRAAIGSYSASTPAAWDEPAEMAIGFAKAILEEDISRYGEACLFARGYMMDVLPGYGSIEEVCHQYVIFGDPSLQLRSEVPWTPEVQLPAVIPVGLPSIEVTVTRAGLPAVGASVVARKGAEFYTAALTGADGVAVLAITPVAPGTVEVWVTAPNAATWEGTVLVTATGCGVLLAAPKMIGCDGTLSFTLFDEDLNLSAGQAETIQILAAAGGAPMAFTLTEDGPDAGKFTGTLPLSATPHQGKLVVAHGDTVTASYTDADCDGAPAMASVEVLVDCLSPGISDVSFDEITAGSARVLFTTDEPADGLVRYGAQTPPSTDVSGPAGATAHQMVLGPLEPATTYSVEIRAQDAAGNLAVDDAGGAYHVFTTPSCTPQCAGKQCGDNGCGGVCGSCCADQVCQGGQCVGGLGCEATDESGCGGCPCEVCVCEMDAYCCNGQWDDICATECVEHCGGCPTEGDCTEKECGDDGCGGSCGGCSQGEECVLGHCGAPCQPDCAGKECGGDGCGGPCGDCAEGTTCSEDQECLDPCVGVGFEGCCNGTTLHYCDANHVMEVDCAAQGLVCGWMDNVGWYDCTTQVLEDPSGEHPLWCDTACKPDCEDKGCGTDGCGGTCGDCDAGETCGDEGVCEPPCPDLPLTGCCDGDVLAYCDIMGGGEDQADCSADGLRCGWDPNVERYNCVANQTADPSGEHPLWCPGACDPDCEGRSCGDDGCGGSCGSCVPGFTCGGDFICTLMMPGDDVVTGDGSGGNGEGNGGGTRSSGGCAAAAPGADPGTPAALLLGACCALLLLLRIRLEAPMRFVLFLALCGLWASAASAAPGPELTPHPQLPGVLLVNPVVLELPLLSPPLLRPAAPMGPPEIPPTTPIPEAADVQAHLRHAVRLPAGEALVFRYDPEEGAWSRLSGPGGLVDEAWDAVDAAPAWIREALAANLADLPADRQIALALLVTDPADPRHRDELAFLLARIAPEDLARPQLSPDYLAAHVAQLHAMDAALDHVELVDTGDPAMDDDFHTTARYMGTEDGETITWEIPREDYYWSVVHPKLDGEELYTISPVTGGFAPPPAGHDFRSYFLDPPQSAETYTLHWVLRAQASHGLGEIPPGSLQGWGPVSRGHLMDFAVDPLVITADPEGRPTTIEFRVGKGTVLATTLEVERAWADGTSDLLENLLRYGPGNVVQNKFQKHLMIRDRAPFGQEGITVDVLDSQYVVWHEITSDQLGETDLSGYRKIIIPSDQPAALYEALDDHGEALDAWLKDGWRILELHLAAPTAGDAPVGLTLPGGFALAAPEETADAAVVLGQPPLASILSGAAMVWDGMDYPGLSGDRPLDPDTFLLDRIGWWVTQNMFDNVAEWGEKHGLQPERSLQPVRIVFNHFGNCGELQDMLTSASRTLLLPVVNVADSNEDHVWNEFLAGDGWHTYQVSWSDSSTHVDAPSVSADDQTGGGKDVSMVTAYRGDGRVHSVSAHYTDTITITVQVKDAADQPMEGVEILLFSESYYDDTQLISGLWGLTDEAGSWTAEVGEDNSYYVRAYSRLGEEPADGVAKVINAAQALAGTKVPVTLQIGGAPTPVGPTALQELPAAAEDRWVRVHSRPVRTLACGLSPYGGITFCDDVGGGTVDLLVLDEANHAAWAAGEPFDAFSFGDDLDGIEVAAAAPLDGPWYVVVLNQDAHDTRRYVELELEVLGPPEIPEPEPEPDLRSEPDSAPGPADTTGRADSGEASASVGGSSSGCSAGTTPTGWPLLLLLLALTGLRRRRGQGGQA